MEPKINTNIQELCGDADSFKLMMGQNYQPSKATEENSQAMQKMVYQSHSLDEQPLACEEVVMAGEDQPIQENFNLNATDDNTNTLNREMHSNNIAE